jgi:hypothetical protein
MTERCIVLANPDAPGGCRLSVLELGALTAEQVCEVAFGMGFTFAVALDRVVTMTEVAGHVPGLVRIPGSTRCFIHPDLESRRDAILAREAQA